jgi:dynactin complex subunit
MEGMTWEEQVSQVREVNPDGVVIDMDTIIESDRPMETFFQQMREQCPDMSPLQLERQADMVSRIVKRHREQEFQAKMKEREEKMRELVQRNVELQRQIDEKEKELEQLRQQQ